MNHDELRLSNVSSWSLASRIRWKLLSGMTTMESNVEKQMSSSKERIKRVKGGDHVTDEHSSVVGSKTR